MGKPIVYQYNALSMVFRRQVIYIWMSAIGPYAAIEDHSPLNILRNPPPASNAIWIRIFSILARELGVFALGDSKANPFVQCQQYLLNTTTDGVLDIIDLSFYILDTEVRRLTPEDIKNSKISQSPDDAIEELNRRFQENCIGYQFNGGKLLKVMPNAAPLDAVHLAAHLYEPVIRPAISLPSLHYLVDLVDKPYEYW